MYKIDCYDNDLFFVCYMIELIARRTFNTRRDVVNKLKGKDLDDLYRYAQVMHCENPEAVIHEFIESAKIGKGSFDNVVNCKLQLPSESTMGKVYMRLILNTLPIEANWKDYNSNPNPNLVLDKIIEVYNSWMSEVIDDYNTAMFTLNPEYIYDCYIADDII